MRYKDEIRIAFMALAFSCAMFAVYAIVPKDAAVAAKAKATVKEAPETAAEAEALRSSQEDAGFNIYTEESNYDYNSDYDSSEDTGSTETTTPSDQTDYVPDPGVSNDSQSSDDVADEGSSDQGGYDSSDQIDYPSDDGSGDTSTDNSYDTSPDYSESSEDTDTSGSDTGTSDTAPFTITTENSNY